MNRITCSNCGREMDARTVVCSCGTHTGITSLTDPCCIAPKKKEYSIQHNPVPIELPTDLLESIERLLWYMPNMTSAQSSRSEFVDNTIYDDLTFSYILKSMGMDETDIFWFPSEFSSEEAGWDNGRVCVNCQKAIMTRNVSQTKTMNFLRHIRNGIAHGFFTIVDGGLLCYDRKRFDAELFTGIIHIRPEALVSAIRNICNPPQMFFVENVQECQ